MLHKLNPYLFFVSATVQKIRRAKKSFCARLKTGVKLAGREVRPGALDDIHTREGGGGKQLKQELIHAKNLK